MSTPEQGWSVPRLQRLSYLEFGITEIAREGTFDRIRQRLLQFAEEKRDRQFSISLGSRALDRYAFWSPTQETLGELMKLGFVEPEQLPSSRRYVDEYRSKTFTLTFRGKEAADQLNQSEPKDRVQFLNRLAIALLTAHPGFSKLFLAASRFPLCIPEFTIEELDRFKSKGGLRRRLGEDITERIATHCPEGIFRPSSRRAQRFISEAIRRRFPKTRTPAPKKELLNTINDAIVAFTADIRKIPLDAISFNVCMAWAGQLALMEQSRYVEGLPGRTIWATARVEENRVHRRGFEDSTDRIVRTLREGFQAVADAVAESRASGYLPIYRVRAQAAFAAGVNVRLVDRILRQIVTGKLAVPYKVKVALGRGTPPPPSEPIFTSEGRRFYNILITEGGT